MDAVRTHVLDVHPRHARDHAMGLDDAFTGRSSQRLGLPGKAHSKLSTM